MLTIDPDSAESSVLCIQRPDELVWHIKPRLTVILECVQLQLAFDSISYVTDIYDGFVNVVQLPDTILEWSKFGKDSNPCWETFFVSKADGIAPGIDPISCIDQKIDGNSIASGYSNGTVEPNIGDTILCKKCF